MADKANRVYINLYKKGSDNYTGEKDGKYYTATGCKGYRWMESEMVKELGKESDIDESYYISLVDDAVSTISKYGDVEMFVSEDVREKWLIVPEGSPEEIPFSDCMNQPQA
jgi:hypothetical protein